MMPAGSLSSYPRLSELILGLAHVSADMDTDITGLALDSRKVKPGDLFLACAGQGVHGMQFADQAITQGARVILCESEDQTPLEEQLSVPVFKIPKLGKHIGTIAERYYGHPSRELAVIGITGTNGKTSCSHFIAQALNEDKPCGVIGTIGSGLIGALQSGVHTTPDAVEVHRLLDQMRSQGARHAVMEVSSHGLVQGRVEGVAFCVGIFTNLTRDHLDYHGNMENYWKAKQLLFNNPSIKYAIINTDDTYGRDLIKLLPNSVQSISYGFEERRGLGKKHLLASSLKQDLAGLHFKVSTPWGDGEIKSTLIGRFNVSNLLASLGALLVLGVPLNTALRRLEENKTLPGRMECLGGSPGVPWVYVDYAHTPDSLANALIALRQHIREIESKTDSPVDNKTVSKKRKLWCVFGCGGDRDAGKRSAMGRIAEQHSDHVIVTDDNPRRENPQRIIEEILSGIKRPGVVSVIRDRKLAIAAAIKQAGEDDVILVAGKGHEDYQVIGARRLPYEGDCSVVESELSNIAGQGSR